MVKRKFIKKTSKPTYECFIKTSLNRFNIKNTVLNRAIWDDSFKNIIKKYCDLGWFLNKIRNPLYVFPTSGVQIVKSTESEINDWIALSLCDASKKIYKDIEDEWNGPINPDKININPHKMSQIIKDVAIFLGADLVGICELDKRWVYEDIEIPHRYAISMAVKMEKELIFNEPSYYENIATGIAYSKARCVSTMLGQFIRNIGYSAFANVNERVLEIPIAIDAGLGELGRNGLLVTPEFGPRIRLCSVTTNLPLIIDNPIDFSVQDHCEKCRKCALVCPAKAIRLEKRTIDINNISNREGILRWPVDFEKCVIYWGSDKSERQSCAKCISVCPFAHSEKNIAASKLVVFSEEKGYGKLRGKVLDDDYNPIEGARILVGSIYESNLTSNDGVYLIDNIIKGRYKARAIKAGYQKISKNNVSIEGGKSTTQDFILLSTEKHFINVMVEDAFGSAGGVDAMGIEDVYVNCKDPVNNLIYDGITNAHGEINFEVSPSRYRVSVFKGGYRCVGDRVKTADTSDNVKIYMNFKMIRDN